MGMTIQCSNCGQSYELTDAQVPQYAGQTITCTKCQKPFTVTTPSAGQVNHAGPMRAPPPQFVVQKGNGMAVAALVSGIASFCVPLIGSILAIVFGILGLQRTRNPAVGGKGLSIAGICLGGVSLVMMPCMISILLPSLNRARETANRVKCASNMRMIGQAMLLYASENRGQYPPNMDLLWQTQEITFDEFVCPSSNDVAAVQGQTLSGHVSYVYLGEKRTNATLSPRHILLYEPLGNHDNDGVNMLFGDGHVEFFKRAQAQSMIQALEQGQNPPP